MEKELFVRAEEVARELGISKPYAYKLVREMNEELKKKGFLTIPGRVSRRYFEEKFYGLRDRQYIKSLYGVKPTDRIFTVTKSYLHREMDRGAKEAGVKRIRIHDLRHSHISLLIDMGFTALAIADRVGHESIDITYRYAHLFPTRQAEMADKLDIERKGA